MGNSFLGRTIVNGARQQALQEPPGRDRRYRESPVAPGCAPTETRTAGESVRADAAGVRADGVRDRDSTWDHSLPVGTPIATCNTIKPSTLQPPPMHSRHLTIHTPPPN